MLTFPTPNATRSARPRPALVVRLELPQRDPGSSSAWLDDSGSARAASSPPAPDLHLFARALEDLLRAFAPELPARISIEPDPEPGQSFAGPQLRPVPSLGPADPESADQGQADRGPADRGQADRGQAVQIDVAGRTLYVDGELVEVTRREFDLLAYLFGRRTVALGRRELMSAVWQTNYLSGDRTIDVHIRRLRLKLGRHAHRLVTLRGFGYRFD